MASTIMVELENKPLKKVSIKTTPATPLKAVVESACEKLKLPHPDSFGLKYQRTMLDLSLTVRFANLPAGAKVFLIPGSGPANGKESSGVTIDTGRTSAGLTPGPSSSAGGLSPGRTSGGFTPEAVPAAGGLSASPTLETIRANIVPTPVAGPSAGRLSAGTTSEIGRTTTEPIRGAVPVAGGPKPVSTTGSSQASVLKSADPVPDTISSSERENSVPTAELSPTPGQIDRDLQIIQPSPEGSEPQNIELPDSFFELTAAEVKAMIAASKSRAKLFEDTPLMTQKMRDREEKLRRSKYPKTMIRVKFPDRLILQATFLSDETIGDLYEVVRNYLHGSRAFTLYTTPPLHNLKDLTLSMWTAKLSPASLVYLRFEDSPQ
ncbi:Tether containing UBX domain for GLUT4 [Dinochytrium kinnereticum]|nr:Tether containing UBX domain for GLUT4 [Dinochytrium kinnereticum]